MKYGIVAFLAVILITIVPLSGYCQENENLDDDNFRTLDGKVISVDTSRSTITVNGGTDINFPISSETTLLNYDQTIKLSDIEPGNFVTVDYYKNDDGSLKVSKVTVQYKEAGNKQGVQY